MSMSSKISKSIQEILKDMEEIDNRLITTIPFGSSIEKANGFISIAGKEGSFPIMTLCVQNPVTKMSTVSTIVFPSKEIYNSLIEKLLVDFSINFQKEKIDEC